MAAEAAFVARFTAAPCPGRRVSVVHVLVLALRFVRSLGKHVVDVIDVITDEGGDV